MFQKRKRRQEGIQQDLFFTSLFSRCVSGHIFEERRNTQATGGNIAGIFFFFPNLFFTCGSGLQYFLHACKVQAQVCKHILKMTRSCFLTVCGAVDRKRSHSLDRARFVSPELRKTNRAESQRAQQTVDSLSGNMVRIYCI